ncbi:MAG: hypothetical protein HQ513_18525 [Rhodospirillales bacterium]|nr:hypothetical protein [Rhodospirillales bacterium]
MTTITPPSAPQLPPTTPSVAPVVVVQSPPPALARLAIGHLLEATVTTQTAKDVFQVQTPQGQLSLQTALTLPKGSTLVLQLQAQSPFVQFQINSLNGGPPPPVLKSGNAATLASGIAARAAVKGSGHAQAATFAKLTPGSILQATVLRPISQPPSQPTGGASPAPGAAQSANAAAAGLTANKGAVIGKSDAIQGLTKPSTTPGLTKPISHAPGDAAVPKTTLGIAPKGTGFLPPGSQLSVRITGVQLPNPGVTSAPPLASGGLGSGQPPSAGMSLSGSVTGSTPAGHTIVQTRVGLFALETQTVVPRGSVITLDVVNVPNTPLLKAGALPTLHESLFTSRKWPALEQVIQVLHEANPATAQQLINSIIPRPDAGLTSGLIFFLAALRGGDLRSWIGDDAMRLIERSRPNLAGRVSENFTALARMADEPSSGDWRVALIPINTGAQIEQIRMLMRQHGGDEEDESETSDNRFIIDVELTTFGRLQLDGLVRNNGKSLDLIIRSEAPLSETMHNDIRSIFLEAAELTGLKGGVNFQAAPALFIDIVDPSSDHALGLVV